jgi:phage-related protein
MGPIGLVIAAVVGLVVVVVKNWDTIRRVTSDLWNTVKRLTGEAWERVKDAVRTGISGVLGFFRAMPGQILGALGNLDKLLLNAGRQVVDGFVRGITSAFGKVRDTLSNLTDMLPDWKGPASKDRVILKDAGRLVIGGLVIGMESQYGRVQKSLTGLTRSIGETVVPVPQFATPRSMGGSVAHALAGVEMVGATVTVNKNLTYNAAPGSSLGAEEDLFAAASRTRMVGW